MGGTGEKRMLRIVARYADDWNYLSPEPVDFTRKRDILHEHCASVGRDPAEITTSCHLFPGKSPTETADQAGVMVEAGVQHLCVYFMDCSDPSIMGPTAEAITAAVGG